VKRAGFVLMACFAVHGNNAVNCALRQIGKRDLNLNRMAVKTAKEIQKIDSKSAKWIASHALRELTSQGVQRRLKGK
jgi:hypothetical protein